MRVLLQIRRCWASASSLELFAEVVDDFAGGVKRKTHALEHAFLLLGLIFRLHAGGYSVVSASGKTLRGLGVSNGRSSFM